MNKNYKIRRTDITKPFFGYFGYIKRNEDSLITHENEEDRNKATIRGLALGAYHFCFIPAIMIIGGLGLEKLLS